MQQRLARIVVVSPFEQSNAAMAIAGSRAGGLGVVDLGHDREAARRALSRIADEPPGSLGVRVPSGVTVDTASLPRSVGTIILEAGTSLAPYARFAVMVEATSTAEAIAAVRAGASAIVAKGTESGGRVGDETSFVLLQSLVRVIDLPIYVQGGIGLRTAAACIAGGAAGVVLDAQMALVRECALPVDVQSAIAAMDGSETALVDGRRVYSRPGWERGRYLPAGQDASLARPLAARFRTTGGVVRGMLGAIERNLEAARCQHALGECAPLAVRHGLRYPIVQGPMTRVSDRAAFADAVADAGGLPFLALALMRGPEVETLLVETAHKLAGKTWGVGILGFVPQELRDEQLEVVRRIKPPLALIAGGRPAQAKPLEELGIKTFLHTPSPGLLDLFLKQGARRFVFEGSECGGHVGPRTSFALWEAQIERLLAHPAPAELEVVFAGGIHDARSAAMVAAMAAPLVERGVAIGVLMGTAYLFTTEAVACGAIQPAFQQAALACDATVLLETAPGHSTRCADTDYVATFRSERERLHKEGVPAQDMWLSLEQLNLGRLRIAAKGLVRDGERIVTVDDATQRREGMVMLGQVAALRDEVVHIGDIHHDISEGAIAHLAALPEFGAHATSAHASDIAIVGMAAIMPGAPDLDAFWSNIVHGVNSIREVPAERWRVESFYDPKSMNGEKTPSKWGGFLDPYPFDPLTYGIPPVSLAAIEPVQLLALEASRRALDDAGYSERDFDRENTSVVFGAEAGTDLAGAYGFRALWGQYVGQLPAELAAALPSMTEDSFPGILGNVIAGRIANRLDLGGTNYTVDAACASSLAAVDVACKELVAGTSNMVVCGGADLHNSIVDYLAFASVHALSPTGQCRTFDASADGIALGEGVAAVVLKRLADAEHDGDRIYAVIKAVGGSSDGKSLGLTAPRAQGQVRALARAYERAGVAPRDVGLVEAHGTGTVVGDRTELETLNQFFGQAGAASGSIALGSIKSQIGHTKCAAGLAGLIKAALAVHRRVLPPTLNVTQPNAAWTPASPFTLSTAARPWASPQRIAGVSAFGFGGTNFHTVVAAYEGCDAATGLPQWPAELFLFRGEDRAAALAVADKVAASKRPLAELARALTGNTPVQIAIVARDHADLAKKIGIARDGKSHSSGVFLASTDTELRSGKLAFLFPGQGSQRVGMLGDLFIAFPELTHWLERGARWRDFMFPATVWQPDAEAAQQAALTDTRVAQPALGIGGLAVAELLQRFGVRPDMLGGHSYGELVALCVAGALPEADLLELSELRGRRILESCADAEDAGTMAAVAADIAVVKAQIAGIDGVVIANENSPEQSVISGPRRGVEQAVAKLLDAQVAAKAIPVACAFHSPLVRGACETFAADLAAIDVQAPALPVYSNTTTAPYPDDASKVRDILARHIGEPVRFAGEIEAMYAAGARIFVEAGPGRVLTGLVGRILGKRPHVAIACDRAGDDGIVQFLLALGQLATHGVTIDADALFAGRDVARVALDAPSPDHSANSWWVNGQRAWPMHGELPANAFRPVLQPVTLAINQAAAAPDNRDAVVLEYLRNMREMVETQRRVVMSYLGTTEAPRAPIEVQAIREEPSLRAPIVVTAVVEAPRAEVLDVAVVLLDIVSQRTGYPPDMLDLDLDLEADLSIDSIKRVEILGAVAERMGARTDGAASDLPENIVALKTLRAIIEALKPLLEGKPVAEPTAHEQLLPEPTSAPVSRFIVQMQPLQRANGAWVLGNRDVQIIGAAKPLESLLLGNLAAAGSRGGNGDLTRRDALVDATALRADWTPEEVPALFGRVRDALLSGVSHVLVAGRAVDSPTLEAHPRVNGSLVPPAGGVSGLIKSMRKEWPDRHVRVATFGSDAETAKLAELILSELNCADDAGEVDYSTGGVRHAPRVVKAERDAGASSGLSLDDNSVVLLTGGARGITARIALEIARRFKCRLELVGRTPLPSGEEDAELASTIDEPALRRLLIARNPGKRPADIEAEFSRTVAAREVRATLDALRAAGAKPTYHPGDVRDRAAFGALIAGLYERYGRLDGVVHGAGVVEDKLARDKTPESFARVFETKVNGALAIAEHVRDDVKFVVFFSSIVATFGNRGQSDYAAANDFLDRLAHGLKHRLAGRVVSINWGPWRDAGMVSAELAREYARRGIDLIEPDAGAASFLEELLHGSPEDAQVILMRGDPTAMR